MHGEIKKDDEGVTFYRLQIIDYLHDIINYYG